MSNNSKRLAPPMVHENHRADKAKERDAIPGIRGIAEDNAKARVEKDAKGAVGQRSGQSEGVVWKGSRGGKTELCPFINSGIWSKN
ncbi:unnamed protein product [Caretta caretta]